MVRVAQLANAAAVRQSLRAGATATQAAPKSVKPVEVPVPKFNPVKFQKEDVEVVMKELPAFSFYEMNDPAPNVYKESTLDRSILIDPPVAKPVAPTTGFSQLENGLKIASVDKQGLTARLGLYVNTGSRYEDASNFGVAHMAALMGYSSTAHLSHLRTVKTLEQLGCNHNATATAGREEIAYRVDVMREFVPLVVPLLVGNVLFPRLLPWEVKAAHKKVKEARNELAGNPDGMVNDLLHRAAFCNNTLGHTTLASDRSMNYFTPETIRNFMLDHFAPERMVLAGVNIEHDVLAKWAMRSFADYNAIPLKKRAETKAVYTGGDLRQEGASPFCHLALAFESFPWGKKELAAATLLQSLLGGGSALVSNPGSGVTSRLYTQVVKQSASVESCKAFNTSFSDSGLFGVYGVSQAEKAGEMVAAIAKSLNGLTTISKDELARGKASLKSSLHRQMDDDGELLQDLAQQVLIGERYGSVSDFSKVIDSLTESEVTAVAKKLLSGKPTVAAFGDTHTVPHYSTVEAMFRA